jgi:hypothetical protein
MWWASCVDMAAVYNSWPAEVDWQFHRQSFQPFHAKNIFYEFPSYSLQELLEAARTRHHLTIEQDTMTLQADILCTSIGNEFSGEESKLEFISLNLLQFLEGFHASQHDLPHWLKSLTDIQLYLSQLSLTTFYSLLHLSSPPIPSLIPGHSTGSSLPDGNIWMNINPVRSSLHYDGNHNILIVCQGWKEVTLISPEYSSLLSDHPISSVACNHSNLSREKMEETIRLNHLPSMKFRLEEGEALFIPEGWWHQVCSGPCTYAINYWFPSPFHDLLSLPDTEKGSMMLPYLMKKCLQTILSTQLKNKAQREESLMDTTLFSLFEEANLLKLRNRFSRASLREMSLHWLPFSQQVSIMSFLTTEIRQNPQLWATLLLSLSDEECYRLTTTWEEEENYQEGQSVERLSQERLASVVGMASHHRFTVKVTVRGKAG